MRRWREDPHTLAGAYALDALTGADRERFERHLAGCEACLQEAGSLREAAARLAAATAIQPPPGLRDAVLAAAARTRQAPTDAAEPARGLHVRRGRAPRGGRAAGRGRRDLALPMAAPRLATAVMGMVILIMLGLGALTINARHRLGVEQTRGSAIAAVLTAPDATMMTARGSEGGTATVVMSHRRGALVLTTSSLPALPAGDRYEVWLMGPGWTRSAGMLPMPDRGMTAPMVVPGLGSVDRIGVTMEPAAGARQPTSAPVLTVALSS